MIYKLFKMPFVGSFMVKWRSPLTDAERLEWQPVSAKSKSGGMIQGLFAKAKTEDVKATIVLGHPMGKEAKGYFLKNGYAEFLRNNGFNTLVFDFNGFGESTNGSFSYFEDVLAIAAEAKKITPSLPMGYHGVSLGAQWAIISFTYASHPFTFAIVESPSATAEEFWIKYPAAYKTLKFLNFFLPRYAKKIRPVERIREVKNLQSMLLIYSYADEWTPVEMGERLKANSSVPTELWTVNDAGHTLIMKSDEQEAYKQKILEYFNTAILSGK
jgi:alpha-beta hydrolase superfamily lysophospholipase